METLKTKIKLYKPNITNKFSSSYFPSSSKDSPVPWPPGGGGPWNSSGSGGGGGAQAEGVEAEVGHLTVGPVVEECVDGGEVVAGLSDPDTASHPVLLSSIGGGVQLDHRRLGSVSH